MVESGSHHSEPEWKLGSLLMLLGHGLRSLRGLPGVYLFHLLNAMSEAVSLEDRRGTLFFSCSCQFFYSSVA